MRRKASIVLALLAATSLSSCCCWKRHRHKDQPIVIKVEPGQEVRVIEQDRR